MKDMNRYALALMATALLFAGCSRQAVVLADPATGAGPAADPAAEETAAVTETPTAAEAPEEAAIDTAAATALLGNACTGCHDLGTVEDSAASSADEWREVIDRMVSYGASVTSDESDLLVAYLVNESAAPETAEASGAGVDAAAATRYLNAECTGCHGLDLIEGRESAFSADEWRGIIDRMASYGASVTPAQTDLLVAYLISQGATP